MPAQPPLKTSVTAIAKTLRDEKDEWESPADKRRIAPEASKPAFLEEEHFTAAQRGTVTHRVLGLVDYALIRSGRLEEALDALSQKGLLTAGERGAVRIPWLKGFFSSPLGQRALKAAEIHREWAFNLRGTGQSMIQGVIDLCFLEDGAWTLVDYKTDALKGEALLEKYATQLRWYARALARITGRPVRQTLLFSLREGQAYPVPPETEL